MMWTLFKKEFANFFLGSTAYVAALAFAIISTLFLWFFENEYNIFNTGNASLNSFFFIAPWILLFLVPALTMKMIAEEKANGTLTWLFTLPIKNSAIIGGKFLAVISVILFCLLPSVLFIFTISDLIIPGQALDYGVIYSGYIGLLLMSCLFAAIGIFTSSISKNQVMAFVLAVCLCFLMFYGFEGLASYNLLGSADFYVQKIGSYSHYSQFLKGIIDTRDLFYFILLIGLFLQFTILQLQRSK